ncbi:MAG: hypothetical protein LUQ01_05125 [Methanolinea sp.]|nr:hypothetical protein [Methanolinea sp.]
MQNKSFTVGFLILAMLIGIVSPATGVTIPQPGEWTGWTTVGDTQASGNPSFPYSAPAVISRGVGMLELLSLDTTGMAGNGSQLKFKEYTEGIGWWGSFGSVVASLPLGTNPVGAAATTDRFDVWARGSNGELYQTAWIGPDWEPDWELPAGQHFGVQYGTGPAVIWLGSHENVLWVDNTTQHLFILEWTGSGPLSGWEYPIDLGAPPGLTLTSSPSVCYDEYASCFWIFSRASDNKLYAWDGGSWLWRSVGGGSDLRGAPSAVSRNPTGVIDVFYVTTGNKLIGRHLISHTPLTWSGEIIIENDADFSDPAAVAWDQDRLDVFVQDTGGAIYQKSWVNPNRIGVFRPPTRQFILKTDPQTRITFGLTTDTPITGDWNADGKKEIGVFRAGQFILDLDNDGVADTRISFGLSTDKPVTGDWDADGFDEIGVFRAVGTQGQFILDNTDYNTAGTKTGKVSARVNFGLSTDKPVTGDWDHDYLDEIGVYRAMGTQGQFILDNTDYDTAGTRNGVASARIYFGMSTDKPVTGDWDKDDWYEIGVFRAVGTQGQFILDNTNYNTAGTRGGTVSSRINFGMSSDIPITGIWV